MRPRAASGHPLADAAASMKARIGSGSDQPDRPQQLCFLPCSWIGGHGTDPYEQKTQQSPGFGLSTA